MIGAAVAMTTGSSVVITSDGLAQRLRQTILEVDAPRTGSLVVGCNLGAGA
jgi:hypothetical protein